MSGKSKIAIMAGVIIFLALGWLVYKINSNNSVIAVSFTNASQALREKDELIHAITTQSANRAKELEDVRYEFHSLTENCDSIVTVDKHQIQKLTSERNKALHRADSLAGVLNRLQRTD